jgi:ferredoxin
MTENRRYWLLTADSLKEMVAGLTQRYQLFGPMSKAAQSGIPEDEGKWVYGRIRKPRQLALDFDCTIMPPKKLFLPAEERILAYERGVPRAVLWTEPFVLFGVHPYDLKAIAQLDKIFTGAHPDANYLSRRRNAILVGLDPKKVSPRSFWASMDSASTDSFDLMLTDIGAGGDSLYVAEVGSEKGATLLNEHAPDARPAKEGDLAARDEVRKGLVTKSLDESRLNFDVYKLPELLPKVMDSRVWEEKSRTCYSCGTCNLVCPTCFCFDLVDEPNLRDMASGERRRAWDGCLLEEFALTGACNFRPERLTRYRHRLLRKGQYIWELFGDIACVGCGRCTRQCLPDIADPADVYNRLWADAHARGIVARGLLMR